MSKINQNIFLNLIIFFNEIMWLYVYQNWFNFNENNISVLRFFSLTLIIIENCWSFFRDTRIMNSTRIKKCYCLWMGYFKFNYIYNLYTKSLWINIESYNKSDRMQEGIDTLLNKFIKLLYYHFVLKLKQSLLLHAKPYDISNESYNRTLNVLILFVKILHWEIKNNTPGLSFLFEEMYLKVYIWISFIVHVYFTMLIY